VELTAYRIYEKYTAGVSGNRLERRFVIDFTNTHVFYEELLEPIVGTCIVESEPIKKQVGLKDWNKWVKTARLCPTKPKM
jgi:hypothetical protein